LNGSHSILQLLLQAGPVVKVIIAMLLLASLTSWSIIFRKRRLLSQAESEANKFEGTFWSGGDLGKLYRQIGSRNKPPVGMESIFEAGFGEFTRLRSQSVPAVELLEGVRRTMRVAQQATLAMVAPGISEALIATAAGLFAAIPAVVAYNRYADKVSRLELRYDAFMDEFSTLLQRHASSRA